jgi:hypothetical protein
MIVTIYHPYFGGNVELYEYHERSKENGVREYEFKRNGELISAQ